MLDLTQFVLLAAVLVGVNQLIKTIRAKDYWGAVTILSAAVVGAVFGLLGLEGLTVVQGIALGFGSVGTLTTASKLGQTSPDVTPHTTAVK